MGSKQKRETLARRIERCKSKRIYESMEEAAELADIRGLTPYACDICGWFHHTSKDESWGELYARADSDNGR